MTNPLELLQEMPFELGMEVKVVIQLNKGNVDVRLCTIVDGYWCEKKLKWIVLLFWIDEYGNKKHKQRDYDKLNIIP